jgi:hypothetical protein
MGVMIVEEFQGKTEERETRSVVFVSEEKGSRKTVYVSILQAERKRSPRGMTRRQQGKEDEKTREECEITFRDVILSNVDGAKQPFCQGRAVRKRGILLLESFGDFHVR